MKYKEKNIKKGILMNLKTKIELLREIFHVIIMGDFVELRFAETGNDPTIP